MKQTFLLLSMCYAAPLHWCKIGHLRPTESASCCINILRMW